jgi:hypothetical protein
MAQLGSMFIFPNFYNDDFQSFLFQQISGILLANRALRLAGPDQIVN